MLTLNLILDLNTHFKKIKKSYQQKSKLCSSATKSHTTFESPFQEKKEKRKKPNIIKKKKKSKLCSSSTAHRTTL